MVLQSNLVAAQQRCMEAVKESQASLENEHATCDEVQLLRKQLVEARYAGTHLSAPKIFKLFAAKQLSASLAFLFGWTFYRFIQKR